MSGQFPVILVTDMLNVKHYKICDIKKPVYFFQCDI